jgi:hypothetical protein
VWACDVWVRWCVECFAMWTVMAVCLVGSGRVDTSAGGCGWQSRHDREGSAGEARRRERDVEGVCVGCCMGIVRGVGGGSVDGGMGTLTE